VGEGSYGEVFKVLDIENSKLMIVKRQKKAESHRSGFQNEHKILSEVTNVTEGKVAAPLRLNVGKLNQTSQYDYFMMDCLGMNLEQLVSKYGPFKISTVKYIGWSIVNKLEALHKLGCLHRDVKT
jgi:serine/threonine protein kinase